MCKTGIQFYLHYFFKKEGRGQTSLVPSHLKFSEENLKTQFKDFFFFF